MNSSSFSEQFFSLCESLGSPNASLQDRLGKYDDVLSDEHRAFVWYRDSFASFRIKDGRVDHLAVPVADAYGHRYFGPKDHYQLEGVRLGMSKGDVRRIWGRPIGMSNRGWACKTVKLANGRQIVYGVGFDEDESGELRVHKFFARPDEAKAKGGCIGGIITIFGAHVR